MIYKAPPTSPKGEARAKPRGIGGSLKIENIRLCRGVLHTPAGYIWAYAIRPYKAKNVSGLSDFIKK